MRTLVKFGLASILLASCVGHVYGQTSEPPPPPKPLKPVKVVGKAQALYFANTNRTRVEVFMDVVGHFQEMYQKKDVLQLRVVYEVAGSRITMPQSVVFFLTSFSSGGLKYSDNHSLSISIEGHHLLTTNTLKDRVNYSPNGISSEYFYIGLSYADFLRVAKSKTVDMEFGATRFQLSPENIEAMNDLIRIGEQ